MSIAEYLIYFFLAGIAGGGIASVYLCHKHEWEKKMHGNKCFIEGYGQGLKAASHEPTQAPFTHNMN